MAFPESFLQELTARNDITDVVSQYVKLNKRSGANLFGLCPFHSEKTPSFSVSPEKQIYHCFGCGKGGGVINFIMEIENLSYPDAVRFLAKRAHLEVPEDAPDENRHRRERMLELNREAARFFHDCLVGPGGETARQYVNQREISGAMVTRFGLGFAPDSWDSLVLAMRDKGYTKAELLDAGLARASKKGDGVYDTFRNRLMFPVIDVRGSVIGFSGRILDDGEPKYMNSPETLVFNKSKNLFALNLAKKSKKGYIILSEGNIDVVALHQAGIDCAVASLGTSLTPEQARLISNYTSNVVIIYDGDSAGQKASQRAINIFGKVNVKVKLVRLTGAKDPDEFIKKFGVAAFENLLSKSEEDKLYVLSDIASKYDLSNDADRINFLKDATIFVSGFWSIIERDVFSHRLADMANASYDAVFKEVERLNQKMVAQAKRKQAIEETQPHRQNQPIQKELRYENVRSAVAEQGIIALLYADNSLFSSDCDLSDKDFSSPALGKIYLELKRQITSKTLPSAATLAGVLSPDEMSLLTSILQKPQDMTNADKALHDYINIIKTEKLAAGRGESPDTADLNKLSEKLRQSKGYGRTDNGNKD
ncbi:MAG: DNA primase [Clostridia bacterium]|nr:DNA primase [Clostridia bacterium]